MTYNVFGGTLNPTLLFVCVLSLLSVDINCAFDARHFISCLVRDISRLIATVLTHFSGRLLRHPARKWIGPILTQNHSSWSSHRALGREDCNFGIES